MPTILVITNYMKVSSTVKTLKNAHVGEQVKVVKVEGEGALRQRILDMGLTKGAEVSISKVAPLGDPIEVTVRGYELSLRKQEAACIIVQ